MTVSARPADAAWTCPFCPLLCDGYGVTAAPSALALTGSDCARAQAALARFDAPVRPAAAEIDGEPADLERAIEAAGRLLAASHQPLFGGLGTDVAGARALYRLACATGAISDAAGGDPLMQGLRVLQDRGGFMTTLAEVRERADLIVCVGSVPSARFPEFFVRCGLFETRSHAASVCLLGEGADADAWRGLAGRMGARADAIAFEDDDLHATAAALTALVAGSKVRASPALVDLAARLQAARYAVIVYEPARLGPQAALVIEMLHRAVGLLNRKTRAAALALGGGDGAATANQVYAWLSGLPLRSRAGPAALQHEPLLYGSAGLVADRAVDAVLWVSSFEGSAPPVTASAPTIVLGPAHAQRAGAAVFIPVATPGIGADGHLFRTDGTVLMPLHRVRDDGLPSVADIVRRIGSAIGVAEVAA